MVIKKKLDSFVKKKRFLKLWATQSIHLPSANIRNLLDLCYRIDLYSGFDRFKYYPYFGSFSLKKTDIFKKNLKVKRIFSKLQLVCVLQRKHTHTRTFVLPYTNRIRAILSRRNSLERKIICLFVFKINTCQQAKILDLTD